MSDEEGGPMNQGGGAPVDDDVIVDGRITFVALLKDVCRLNSREVSSLAAFGITDLFTVRRLKTGDWIWIAMVIWLYYVPIVACLRRMARQLLSSPLTWNLVRQKGISFLDVLLMMTRAPAESYF
jgi:hypothetical protein